MMKSLDYFKRFITKIDWYRQATDSYRWYIGDPEMGVINEFNSISFYCTEGRRFEGYYATNEMYNQSKLFYDKQQKNRNLINNYIKKFKKIEIKIDRLFNKTGNLNLPELNYDKLIVILNKLSSLNIKYWENNFICDKFDPFGDRFLKHDLNKKKITLQKDEIYALTCSKKLNFIERCELDLHKIAYKHFFKKNNDNQDLNKQLKQVLKKYYFIENSWAEVRVLNETYFLNKILKLRKESGESLKERIVQLISKEDNLINTSLMLIKTKKLDKSLQNSLYLFEKLSELRDERKEYVLKFNHFLDLFIKPIAKKFKIPHNLLYNGLPSEIYMVSDIKSYKKELEKRRIARCHIGIKKEHYFYSGNDSLGLIELIHSEFTNKIKSIKGNCASPGKVRGIARVIMGESHFTKFKKGDVLIAPMTRPEYVPLMKKAKAIVTDEGGLTCHATIISRELKKPCVIGTQVATKKLIDGEYIEVDANQGIVKILK